MRLFILLQGKSVINMIKIVSEVITKRIFIIFAPINEGDRGRKSPIFVPVEEGEGEKSNEDSCYATRK